jgi:hypothetical protein
LTAKKAAKPTKCPTCKLVGEHAPPCPSYQGPKPQVDDLAKRRRARKLEVPATPVPVIETPSERVPDHLVIDSRDAHLRERIPAEGPEFGEVAVRMSDVFQLQTLFDLGRISIPGIKLDDVCRVHVSKQWKGSVIEVACPHRAVLRQIEKTECEACHAHKSNTVVYLCLLHAVEHYGGGAPIKDLGPLFGADQPRTDAQPKPEGRPLVPRCENCQEYMHGRDHFDGEMFTCEATIA